ncbi:hypothetical protein [Pseudomarimonas arenosa]|uniref:Lysozyme inhibitor LprI N-terminal domain-containing protein n=1 Tax=Pseudomarimonas arenosa TaxID=2774145 RepID=A0AAW3ZN53_9GAMM|nr:hypothetical protein [Pseudomarimonas arenosa]MBD8526502.1 hypothetical protein [Pseudomarimonas arenosa]
MDSATSGVRHWIAEIEVPTIESPAIAEALWRARGAVPANFLVARIRRINKMNLKNSTFLAKVIFGALATGAMFCSDPVVADASCDELRCRVTEPMPWTPPPPPPPCQTCQGNSPGSGDSPGGDAGGQPTVPPEACQRLAADGGPPPDCDRNVANSGANPLDGFVPDGISQINFAGSNFWLGQTAEASARALNECYQDISNSPHDCDMDYLSTWGALTPRIARMADPIREAWDQSMWDLMWDVEVARQNREIASWFGDSQQFSYGGIGINLNLIGRIWTLDRFNQMLIASRKQKLCEWYFAIWDQNSCSNY